MSPDPNPRTNTCLHLTQQVPKLQDPRGVGAPFRLRRDRLLRDERGCHGGHAGDEPSGVRVRRGLGGNGRGHAARLAAGPDSGVLAGRGEFGSESLFVAILLMRKHIRSVALFC